MNEEALERMNEYWAENKLCFSTLPKEDAQDLLKVIILQSIDGNWGAGFVNLARLELLTRAFPEDGLLIEIHRHLNARCNDAMIKLRTERGDAGYMMEHCFRDQPTTYNNHGRGPGYWYNVNDDQILKKLIQKHPALEGAIQGVVYR